MRTQPLQRTLTPADIEALVEQLVPALAERLANQPKLVDREEFARMVGLSISKVDRYIRSGVIPVVKAGRRIKINPEAAIAALSAPAEVEA